MAFRKPKKNTKKVIDREDLTGHVTPSRTSTLVAHNFYEAGPSGVEFTDRVLEMELQDNPRPAKLVRLHSPPRFTTSATSSVDRLSSVDRPVPSLFNTHAHSFELQHNLPSPHRSTGECSLATQTIPLKSVPAIATTPVHPPPTNSDDGHHRFHRPANIEHGDSKKKRVSDVNRFARDCTHLSKVQKTAHEKLDEARSHIPLILLRLLEREAHPHIPGKCQRCEQQPALYRCCDCSEPPALCRLCICEAHRNAPFHWVEEWVQPQPNVSKWCFRKRDLSQLGFVYCLGHQGQRCRQVASGPPKLHNLVITHVNGIHDVSIKYCECSSPRRVSQEEQLVLAGLIPASFQKLQSAFSVEVLQDAHEDILSSRKSTYDYIRKLRRRTNNSAAHLVTVSYSIIHSEDILT